MIRKAFKMTVYPGKANDYEQRHHPMPAAVEQALKKHGVSNYSLFFDNDTYSIFGYVELERKEQWNDLAAEPAVRKWWESLDDVLKLEINTRPMSRSLREVYHLD